MRENDFQLEFYIQPNHQLKIKIDYRDIFMHHKSLKQRNNSRKEKENTKGKMKSHQDDGEWGYQDDSYAPSIENN